MITFVEISVNGNEIRIVHKLSDSEEYEEPIIVELEKQHQSLNGFFSDLKDNI